MSPLVIHKPRRSSMSDSTPKEVVESIKPYLIVGETLDGTFSFVEYKIVNIFTVITLMVSSGVSFYQALVVSTFWWLLGFGFLVGAIYFALSYQIDVTYAITKFRIIRLENDLISKWFFRSSRLIGFTDLHYEHVESIQVSGGRISNVRFYGSLITIALGWAILLQQPILGIGINIVNLVGTLMIVIGSINVIFSLPLGGVRLIVQSISGDIMEFPESKTPEQFASELIINCRTFLSYGAE